KRAVELDLKDGGRFEHVREWAGKFPGLAIRVAGNLHCADYSDQNTSAIPINTDTMRRALELAAVIATHSLTAFDLMGGDPSLKAARKLWKWVERNHHQTFTFRDAFRALQGSFPRTADLESAVAVLIERYYIEEVPAKPRAGRPSRTFHVNSV